MRELVGRTAVVTGAASGIGRATATRFAREGMKVVLADIETEPLARAEQDLAGKGHEVLAVATDVSSFESVQNLAQRAVERFGAVHVVHNNAGVVVGGSIWELSFEDWNWVLGVNLWGVIHGIKAFVPLIRQAGEGHVVNTASTAGLQSAAMIAPYNVSKFGVVALSETLALELRAEGAAIGVSVLCPGATKTRIVESDRNRDPDDAKHHRSSPQEEEFIAVAGRLLRERGMDPTETADLVVRAIREDRFWILTHPESKQMLQERVEALVKEDRLARGFMA